MKFRFLTSVKNLAAFSFLLTLIFSSIPTAQGKDFWEKKEYTEWSKKDCRKMLTDSPWVEKHEVTSIDVNMADATASDGRPPYVKYQVQLYSALPVRQAIVRQAQIENKYEDLSSEQKQQLDQQTDPILNANYADHVVVYVTYESNLPRNVITQLVNHWQTQNTDRLKFSVFLNGSNGERVPLSQYVVSQSSQQAFQFVFPRKVDGREIIGPDDKELILEFKYPSAGRIGGGTAFVTFKTKKMMYKGKLEY
jgi:hypothetical protein